MKHEKPRRPVNEVVFEGLQRDRSSYRREDLSRAILLLRFYNGIWGSQAIEANVRNLGYELDFGAGAPFHEIFPEWDSLSNQAKTAVSSEVLPKILDFANSVTGAQEFARVEGLGGWGEWTNPSFKSRFVASPEVAGDTADIIGYLAEQTQIFAYRWFETGKKLGVAVYGDADTTRQLWDHVVSVVPDLAAGFSPSVHQGRPGIEILLHQGGKTAEKRLQDELFPAINATVEKLGIEVDVSGFRAQEESREHDWTQDPTGGSYLARLGARYGSALPERLELFKRQELIPAIRQSIDRNVGAEATGSPTALGQQVEVAGSSLPADKPANLPLAATPPIPGFAEGTDSTPEGAYLVGEDGPELMMGAGQRIIPARETRDILAAQEAAADKTAGKVGPGPETVTDTAIRGAMALAGVPDIATAITAGKQAVAALQRGETTQGIGQAGMALGAGAMVLGGTVVPEARGVAIAERTLEHAGAEAATLEEEEGEAELEAWRRHREAQRRPRPVTPPSKDSPPSP